MWQQSVLSLILATCWIWAGAGVGEAGTGARDIEAQREAEQAEELDDVLDLSLDDLLDVDVRVAAKKQQVLAEVAAAVTVLSVEDIRRSGHTRLSEMLRLVPGFHVARIDANKWSVSSRGLAGRFTDKLLVMIDGRSVYTPAFAGVFWEVQDVFLPDLDRVEAIRGPGATVWGANAVNGVVSVTTKSARETQGTVVEGGGGLEESGFFGVRHGGVLGDDSWYRVYFKGFHVDDGATAAGGRATDDWRQLRGGMRADWDPDGATRVTLQGEIYTGDESEGGVLPVLGPPFVQPIASDVEVGGGHLLGRWTRQLGDSEEVSVQAYLDFARRRSPLINADRDAFDAEFVHRFASAARAAELTWGARYRVIRDRIRDSAVITVTPRRRTTHLFSAFAQGELRFLDDRLILTAGTKIEHNDFTGVEVQPSVRLLYKPDDRRSIWIAVSRAVRTPSRADDDLRLVLAAAPGDPPTLLTLNGTRGMESEELIAFELGYRLRPVESLSIDFAAFVNLYDRLRDFAPGAVIPSAEFVEVGSVFTNGAEGEIYGGELALRWRATPRLAVLASYSYSRAAIHAGGPRTPVDVEADEGQYPRNIAHATFRFTASPKWELDLSAQYADALVSAGIPSYIRLDARIGWRPREDLLVELVLQNLLDDRHPEFAADLPFFVVSEVETAAFLRVTYRW